MAYLIVLVSKETEQIVEVTIWSSPEWSASRQLPNHWAFVAYQMNGKDFQDASKRMIETIKDPNHRYYDLYRRIK